MPAYFMQVWSVVPVPDGTGFVSCSADHSVRFWEWEILSGQANGSDGQAAAFRRLSARHVRTLKMSDDVLCVRISPDGRLIAAALLDSTIQVRNPLLLLGVQYCMLMRVGTASSVSFRLSGTVMVQRAHKRK